MENFDFSTVKKRLKMLKVRRKSLQLLFLGNWCAEGLLLRNKHLPFFTLNTPFTRLKWEICAAKPKTPQKCNEWEMRESKKVEQVACIFHSEGGRKKGSERLTLCCSPHWTMSGSEAESTSNNDVLGCDYLFTARDLLMLVRNDMETGEAKSGRGENMVQPHK